MSKWFELGIERMKMSDDGKVVEIMMEPDDEGNVYFEIPFDVLVKFVDVQLVIRRKALPCVHNSLASRMVCTECGEVVA